MTFWTSAAYTSMPQKPNSWSSIAHQHTLTVGNSTMSPWSSAKYLGLTIDNRLTFSRHIDLLVGKIAGELKTCLSITHVNRLFTISKRSQSISFGYSPSANIAPIRARHNLIPLCSLLLFKRLVVVFRSLYSLGVCLLDSLFSFGCNSNRTSTVTRAKVTNCLALPDVRTKPGLQSLSYTATKEWNSLPPLIRCVCSQPAFLMHLRNHLGHPVKRLRSVGTADINNNMHSDDSGWEPTVNFYSDVAIKLSVLGVMKSNLPHTPCLVRSFYEL